MLKITSHMKQQGELVTKNYSVADLVVPIRDFGPVEGSQGMQASGFNVGLQPSYPGFNMGQMNVSSTGMPPPAGQAFAQVDDREGARRGTRHGHSRRRPARSRHARRRSAGRLHLADEPHQHDHSARFVRKSSTVRDRAYRTTLSLVIRQTQAVHDEIADLLRQLRRLQDLQVTIEVRFVTVSDYFFERIGVDFNFNAQHGEQRAAGIRPAAASVRQRQSLLNAGFDHRDDRGDHGDHGRDHGRDHRRDGGGTTGGTAGPPAARPVRPARGWRPIPPGRRSTPPITRTGRRYGAIAGLTTQNQFTSDLTVPFKQGSFAFGVPKFGGFDPNVGLNVGFAILSDIETFFLINATQGDTRNNLLFAPKVTLFNGQTATVTSNT